MGERSENEEIKNWKLEIKKSHFLYNPIMNPTAITTLLIQLALAADEKLPTEKKRELLWLILFVVAAGVTLLTIVLLLLRTWRRNLDRLKEERKQLAAIPDIWKAGGDRLTAKMSPFPKADDSDINEPPDDDQRENDDDPPFAPQDDDDDQPPPRR